LTVDESTLVLGIETSCDETAAAIVTSDRQIVAQRIASPPGEIALALDGVGEGGAVLQRFYLVTLDALVILQAPVAQSVGTNSTTYGAHCAV
jgi:N6-L-threonylcarbamoyladenine synthase